MTVVLHTATVGDLAVLGDSYLRLTSRGAWAATCVAATKKPPVVGEPALLTITGEAAAGQTPPSQSFVGVVRRFHVHPGRDELVVSLIGGAGGLATILGPADQIAGTTSLPAGLALRSITDAAGERLAAGVEQAFDTFNMPRWTRLGGTTAHDALDQLTGDIATVTGLEVGWRILPDGTLWAGVEAWAPGGAADFIDDDGDDGTLIYAPNGAPLLPGFTIDTFHVVEVLYLLNPPQLRARVRHAVPGDPPFVARGLELFRASYAASVVVQNVDGTLDVRCDDARVGELRSVPFRLGIPGASVTGIPADTRVRVAFENGSPRGAYACEMDQDATATHALALVGDGCGYLSATVAAAPGPVTFILSPTPTGAPGEVQITVKGPGHKFVRGLSA
jgi:hypothetical protein